MGLRPPADRARRPWACFLTALSLYLPTRDMGVIIVEMLVCETRDESRHWCPVSGAEDALCMGV